MANPDILAKVAAAAPNAETDLPSAIQRYLNGESMQVLAKEMGIARQTLYRWMLSDIGPTEWQSLKRDALIYRIADADANMETAATTEDIARAREQMRFSRMDYERRFPKLYGPKQEINVDNNVTIIVQRHPPPIAPPVIPYVDVQSAIAEPNPEVIDKKEDTGNGELTE